MLKFSFLVAFCVLVLNGANAQNTVRGYVYNDKNENGKKENREKGIAEVAVTNGEEVVLTDAKGRYELPINEDAIIAVIKPSGYKVNRDGNNLPQFYYIHKPNGSPDLKYDGVKPTGKLPKSVDFGLITSTEKNEFKAVVFGDPQPRNKEELDYFDRGVVSEIYNTNEFSFGLSLGDLMYDDLSLFDIYKASTEKVGIPWYNVLGNHDQNYDVEKDQLADETFESHFGPANYSFNYGKVHFIVLDNILYPDPRDGKGYWGGFREDQLKFIENDLKFVPRDYLVVLAFHIPISEVDDRDIFKDKDRQKLFSLLKGFPNTLSLSAHSHLQRQDFFSKEDGEWLQDEPHHHYNVGTTSGDWYSGEIDGDGIPISTMRDGTPKGYAIINFKENNYTIDYKVVGKDENHRMKIFAPQVVEQNKRSTAGIFVNFYMGTEGDNVEFRVNNGEWKKMNYLEEYDPNYLGLLHKWDFTNELLDGFRPHNPIESKHLWRAPVPRNLDVGEHIIEVKVIDMFGREFREKEKYRIDRKD